MDASHDLVGLYPLGLTGAYPTPPAAPTAPDEHRLRRIVPWLDHAVELGASGVALGPDFTSAGHGYDTTDNFRIDPRLGNEADFDHPLAAAALRDGPASPASGSCAPRTASSRAS